MAFGLSFGAQHQKQKATDTVNKTESTTQQQTGTQSTSGTTATTGSQSTQSQQNTSQQAATQNQQQTSTAQQSQSTQFSEPILGTLEGTVQSLMGTLPGSPQTRSDSFDPNAFVSGGVEAARASINTDLENALNGIFDNVGGRDSQNSMATLLANRTRGDAAAQLAGIRSSLTGQAQGIESQRFQDNLAGVGQQEGFLSQVLDALKGGRSASSSVGSESTSGGTTSSQTGQATGSENTQSSQTQVQNIIQQISQLLSGTTNTTGTENQTGSGTTVGGGLSLGL